MGGGHTLQMLILPHHFFQSKALFRPALGVLSPPWGPGAHGCFSGLTSVSSSFWQEALLCPFIILQAVEILTWGVAASSCLTRNLMSGSNNCYL